jgi:hypothetical protein
MSFSETQAETVRNRMLLIAKGISDRTDWSPAQSAIGDVAVSRFDSATIGEQDYSLRETWSAWSPSNSQSYGLHLERDFRMSRYSGAEIRVTASRSVDALDLDNLYEAYNSLSAELTEKIAAIISRAGDAQ